MVIPIPPQFLEANPALPGPEVAARAMPYVIDALQDPLKPSRCAESLSFALLSVAANYLQAPDSRYVPMRDTLHRSLYKFVTAQRTETQLDDMLKALCVCSCPEAETGPSSFHAFCIESKVPKETREEDVKDFVEHCFRELVFELHCSNDLSIRKGVSKIWPESVSALMPFGPDEVVKGMRQWYAKSPNVMIRRWAFHVLKIAGAVVHAAFDKYDITNVLYMDNIREVIDCIVHGAAKHIPIFIANALPIECNDFFSYMFEVAHGQEPAPGTSLMNGAETKAVQLCSLLLYIAESPCAARSPTDNILDIVKTQAPTLGRVLFRKYQLDQHNRQPIPLHPAIIADDRFNRKKKPRTHGKTQEEISCEEIVLSMYSCRFFYLCSGPNCPSLTKPDVQLHTCAGCSTVRYCSKTCQKTDWKSSKYPHKNLCKIFAGVVSIFGSWKPRSSENTSKSEPIRVAAFSIKTMRSMDVFNNNDFEMLCRWAQMMSEIHDSEKPLPDEECRGKTGYKDYELLLRIFTNPSFVLNVKGPKPQIMDRLEL